MIPINFKETIIIEYTAVPKVRRPKAKKNRRNKNHQIAILTMLDTHITHRKITYKQSNRVQEIKIVVLQNYQTKRIEPIQTEA